jgi:hypothetical protein
MRNAVPVLAACLAIASLPALAQGTPQSGQSSNNGPTDTHSTIAPQLPTPAVGPDASARQFLLDARQALAAGRTGEAQEALERAETRLLDRAVAPSRAEDPNRSPLVTQITAARQALGNKDMVRTLQIVDAALSIPPLPAGHRYAAVPPPRAEHVPPSPGVRYVWVPGHWLWNGSEYVWNPGSYLARPAPSLHFIPGHWEPRGGGWVWVAPHWA